MRNHGMFIPCRTMVNLDKTVPESINDHRTPSQLTTRELQKKLCDDGPLGCNEQCENWSVCKYGQEFVKRADRKITYCACGCGQAIRLVSGNHLSLYVKGHQFRKKGEDHGA